ncbi:MAG: hypothetical protein IPO87_06450 [Flavobacteriales bacterium]|nr:hypothetical protein [Flavobacteriales bacterium]
MPRRDGYATMEWIREYQPDTRMMALSHALEDGTVYHAMQSGAHAVVEKGIPTRSSSPVWKACAPRVTHHTIDDAATHACRTPTVRGHCARSWKKPKPARNGIPEGVHQGGEPQPEQDRGEDDG